MDQQLPQTMGYEAAGIVDELGEGVADVAIGDRVFGFAPDGAAQAELAVLSDYAHVSPSLDFWGGRTAGGRRDGRACPRPAGRWRAAARLINGASGSASAVRPSSSRWHAAYA
jgi:hypothetical protein